MKCITDVQMLRLSRVFPDSSCRACRTGPSGAWPRPPVEVTGSLLKRHRALKLSLMIISAINKEGFFFEFSSTN